MDADGEEVERRRLTSVGASHRHCGRFAANGAPHRTAAQPAATQTDRPPTKRIRLVAGRGAAPLHYDTLHFCAGLNIFASVAHEPRSIVGADIALLSVYLMKALSLCLKGDGPTHRR